MSVVNIFGYQPEVNYWISDPIMDDFYSGPEHSNAIHIYGDHLYIRRHYSGFGVIPQTSAIIKMDKYTGEIVDEFLIDPNKEPPVYYLFNKLVFDQNGYVWTVLGSGWLVVFDTVDGSLIQEIPLGYEINRDYLIGGMLAFDPVNEVVLIIKEEPIGSGLYPELLLISTNTYAPVGTITLPPLDVGAWWGYASMDVNTNTGELWVGDPGDNDAQIHVYDIATGTLIKTIVLDDFSAYRVHWIKYDHTQDIFIVTAYTNAALVGEGGGSGGFFDPSTESFVLDADGNQIYSTVGYKFLCNVSAFTHSISHFDKTTGEIIWGFVEADHRSPDNSIFRALHGPLYYPDYNYPIYDGVSMDTLSIPSSSGYGSYWHMWWENAVYDPETKRLYNIILDWYAPSGRFVVAMWDLSDIIKRRDPEDPFNYDTFGRELILDLKENAFTLNNISHNDSVVPRIHDYIRLNSILTVPELWDESIIVNKPRTTNDRLENFKYLSTIDGNITISEYRDNWFKDWRTIVEGGIDYDSYLLTGPIIADNFSLNKQAIYLSLYFWRTEFQDVEPCGIKYPSSCWVNGVWDWHGKKLFRSKITDKFQAYKLKDYTIAPNGFIIYPEQLIITKHKLRGRGRSLSLIIRAEQGKDLRLLGYGALLTKNDYV